jgi:hypothetical protein
MSSGVQSRSPRSTFPHSTSYSVTRIRKIYDPERTIEMKPVRTPTGEDWVPSDWDDEPTRVILAPPARLLAQCRPHPATLPCLVAVNIEKIDDKF